MRAMLLEHMADHAPKLKARLWRAVDRNAFLDERVDAALKVLKWNLESLDRPDPNGEAMAREMANRGTVRLSARDRRVVAVTRCPPFAGNRRRAQPTRRRFLIIKTS